MEFPEVVAGLARTAPVWFAQEAIRAQYGKGASRWVAAEAGLSQRQAQRWLSANFPRSRAHHIRQLVAASAIFSHLIQHATQITVGKVSVYYKGTERDEGIRSIPSFPVGDAVAEHLQNAVNDLNMNDLAGAADAFSDAVICGYEPGLEDTLGISDYNEGAQIEV